MYRAVWNHGRDRRAIESRNVDLVASLIDLPVDQQADMVRTLADGGEFMWSWWTITETEDR